MDRVRRLALLGLFAVSAFSWRLVPATPQVDSLREARDLAVRMLEAGQGPEGYWPTEFTPSPEFRNAKSEVNNFLQPIIIALLQPLTDQSGLDKALGRARDYTLKQIGDNGLAPFTPSFDLLRKAPSLCRDMTPDADDTALAWSLAPTVDMSRLALALQALRAFRTPDGLFRTWLADEKDFRCLAPGADPNPPDIGINFHVYLLLARFDPDSAKALCRALMARAGDGALWVYYAQAPLVPLLRLGDVRRAGCPVVTPPELARPVDDAQTMWVKAISLLDADLSPGARARDDAVSLLSALAQNRFAAIEASPPLLYHNDLTSAHKRDYWSKYFGYALWLRLYARVMTP
jgi:hypothetical protein